MKQCKKEIIMFSDKNVKYIGWLFLFLETIGAAYF